MTAYDAAMAGVILAGMAWGAFKGITWQVASLVSLVLGYTAAHTLSGRLAPYLPGEPIVARALAMVLVYVGTSAAVFFVAWMIRATLQRLKFEAYDRHLGMLLGGVEGALLGLLATLFVVSLAPQTRGPIFSSPTGKVVGAFMSAVGPVLPEEARTVLAPFWSPGGALAAQEKGPGTDPATMSPATADPAGAAGTSGSLGGVIQQEESRLGRAIVGRSASGQPAETGSNARRDGATTPTSLGGLIQQEEARLGRAIADGATQDLRNAAGGGTDDRAAQRR